MKRVCTAITFALALTLQGCFVVGAAAGAAAIAMVYDHRKVETVMEDQHLANAVVKALQTDPHLSINVSHIDVTCFNRVILLSGETPDAAWREQAEKLANTVPGITRVYNQISVEGPTSSLTRTSDAWITTKIKTTMLATKGLQSGTIKVITNNGVVYLMGMVSHEQGDAAAEIARQVSGVRKVMKIFQYTA